MKINFIDLKSQYLELKTEIDEAILSVLDSGQYVMGPEVDRLEETLAAYTGSLYSVAVSSGTDALLISLMALGIGPGDEVITTPFTFFATAEVITLAGATPVFTDIDEETYNIDPAGIEEKITEKTKAIIPVALYGQAADMDEINDVALSAGISVIEDACQSFGATYKGRKSCNLSLVGCTSFYPAKPLGCYGDGGAVFTSDQALATRFKEIRNHGQAGGYEHRVIGLNARLDAVQAAVLNVKMKYYAAEVAKRELIGARYTELLKDKEGVVTPVLREGNSSVYAQYSVRVTDRDAFSARLKEAGIPTAVHYPRALHMQEAYAGLGLGEGSFPVAERVATEIVSLPMSAFLTETEQDYIVNVI